MKKYIGAALIASCMLLALTPGEAMATGSNPFHDIKTSDWFYSEVQYAYDNGLMKGTGDSTFSPDGSTTRGMIVTILHRIEGEPMPTGECSFQDIAPASYDEQAIIWAASNGIVNGYSAEKFGPDDAITREQMAAILYRYASLKGYDVSSQSDISVFSDYGQISSYAITAMSWANEAKLITGTSTTTLSPQETATRAQVAVILSRFCNQFDVQEDLNEDKVFYQVSFMLNDGGTEIYKTVMVENGKTVAVPAVPSRNDYSFGGWYTAASNGELFNFNSSISGDTSLYAHWTKMNGGNDNPQPIEPADELENPPAYEGVEASKVDENSDNIFKLSAVPSADKSTVEVTLTLCGNVSLCGFDMQLIYDTASFALSGVDTNCDLQVYSSGTANHGYISFNYAAAKNITGTKTILKATFDVLGELNMNAVFSMKPVEIIMTDEQYEVVEANYTLTYCSAES